MSIMRTVPNGGGVGEGEREGEGYRRAFLPETSSRSLLHVCDQQRPWQTGKTIRLLRYAGTFACRLGDKNPFLVCWLIYTTQLAFFINP